MEMHESASIMALALLVCMLLGTSSAQDSDFQLFSPEDAPALSQNPDLLDVTAKTGETIKIQLNSPDQTGFFQENVNVLLDCTPWLMRFPGGGVRWFSLRFDPITGMIASQAGVPVTEVAINLNRQPNDRIQIMGTYNEILNITATALRVAAEDPTAGIYRCEVCVPPEPSDCAECHSSNTTVFLQGKPPVVNGVNRE